MSTLADSLVSSSARRLTVRVRPDLSAKKQVYQGRSYWVVKDPVGLNYFRFQEEEFAIMQMLDGETSLDEVKAQFEAEFPPQKITVEELAQFVGSLHRSGLIIADVPGQGTQLKKRHDERMWKEWLGFFSNILGLRFKGIDPENLLNFLLPFVRWMFHPAAATLCMMFALSALLLVLSNFEVFQSKLPRFHVFFARENWIYMFLVLGVTKIIHEFGHGLSCKYYGGECHEMGVMLLVLTPCLYCNVSDSWMLPNKWHRAIIGAAGMYIEVLMASVATYVWWFTEPGLLNQLALSVMFICSVSTLIFNGNPLLRYDGYYILSDILEIPNLRQKSNSILSRFLAQTCLGIEQQEDPFLPQRNRFMFGAFTVAATIYRWVVLFSILWFLNQVFEPYGLKVLGQIVAATSIVTMIVQPLYQLWQFMNTPGRLRKMKYWRVYTTVAVVASLLAGVFFIPFPYRVLCPFEIRPRGAETVYVEEPGVLEQILVKPGDSVDIGTPLAVLTASRERQLAVAEASKEIAAIEQEIAGIREQVQQSVPDREREQAERALPEAGVRLEKAKQILADLLRDRVHVDIERGADGVVRTTLKSSRKGVVIAPEYRPKQESPEHLSSWYGTPLEERNLGAFLDEKVVLCQIGQPGQYEALLATEQTNVDFVKVGQRVDLQFESATWQVLKNFKVTRKLDRAMEEVPRTLQDRFGGGVLTKTAMDGTERPMDATFQVTVELPDNLVGLQPGERGRAKVYAGYQTLWKRAFRYLAKTVNFDL